MKKFIVCAILLLSLTGCTSKQDVKPYYIVDGKIYECEIVDRSNIFPTVRYLKDGEWIYDVAYSSDIVYLLPEDVK